MNSRNLKIYRGNGRDYDSVPEIRLKGKWMEELGFSIGDTIQADCEHGRIIIHKPDASAIHSEHKNRK